MITLLEILRKLFRPRRYHHRSEGPVIINPDTPEDIHVWGNAKDRNLP